MDYSTSAQNPFAVIDVSDDQGQYINSFCITHTGTWLISVTVGHSEWGTVYTRRSEDRGRTWQDRVMVMEPGAAEPGRTLEMGQLLPLPDRIYQFHIRHTHRNTRFGEIKYTVSRDDGRTWEGPGGPGTLYSLKSPVYELSPDNDGWHLMAPGLTLSNGEWLLPMNISTDPIPLSEIRSELVFAVSRGVFDACSPEAVEFAFFPGPPHGVHVPLEAVPGQSLGQEPQVVELSDGRLLCVCRTGNGCVYYTVSDDLGRTWREARPLRYREGGERLLHPNAPCPLSRLSGGRYALLFCNNDGSAFGGADPFDHTRNRNPVYVAVGRETQCRDGQPVEFSEPRLLCDIEGFRPEIGWRDLTYGLLMEDRGEFYHFYNAAWRNVQVNRVDPALLE